MIIFNSAFALLNNSPLYSLAAHVEEAHDHAGEGFWSDFMNIASDPAHWAFELMFSLIFDLLIVSLIYGVIIRKIIIPRLKKNLHEEIDKEHGIVHDTSLDK